MALALRTAITVWLEYWLLMSVCNGIPALSKRSRRKMTTRKLSIDPEECTSTSQEAEYLLSLSGIKGAMAERSLRRKPINWCLNAPFIGAYSPLPAFTCSIGLPWTLNFFKLLWNLSQFCFCNPKCMLTYYLTNLLFLFSYISNISLILCSELVIEKKIIHKFLILKGVFFSYLLYEISSFLP